MSKVQLADQIGSEKKIFYFKSYGKVIGSARDLKELLTEMRRLEFENPYALKYHLAEGHVVQWLHSMRMDELAEKLDGVSNIALAERFVYEFLERSTTLNRMSHGRMH